MKVVSAEEMALIDSAAINNDGILGAVLMENAGRQTAFFLRKLFPSLGKVLVLCGPGNNGGDGYVLARTLNNLAYSDRAVCLSLVPVEKLSGDALLHARIFQKQGGTILVLSRIDQLPYLLTQCGIIVDAVFGTGLKRNVEGLYYEVFQLVNASGKPVMAIDIPSGVCSDTGRILGLAIKAQATVTIGLPKRGLYLCPGRKMAGKIKVAEIGFSSSALENKNLKGHIASLAQIKKMLPEREIDSHKATCGFSLTLGGSKDYYGAPLLAASAAYRAGSGFSCLCMPGFSQNLGSVALSKPELLFRSPECKNGYFAAENINDFADLLTFSPDIKDKQKTSYYDSSLKSGRKAQALCLGPGMGRNTLSQEFVRILAQECTTPMVIDADGLYHLSNIDTVFNNKCVLTPHLGELCRLLHSSKEEVTKDPINSALKCAQMYQCVVVFKGKPTIVADFKDGEYWIVDSGTSVLSQAGTGDVLAGVITGLLAQNMSVLAASVCGAYIHGAASKVAYTKYGPRGILAHEIADLIPCVYKKVLGTL